MAKKCKHCGSNLASPGPAADEAVILDDDPFSFVNSSPGGPSRASSGYPPRRRGLPPGYSSNRVAAGICGIMLGALGVHKFILGLTTPGIIMVLVTLLTCGFGAAVMGIIGLVEGIIYLTKSEEEFYQRYIVDKQGWF